MYLRYTSQHIHNGVDHSHRSLLRAGSVCLHQTGPLFPIPEDAIHPKNVEEDDHGDTEQTHHAVDGHHAILRFPFPRAA